ncbi:NAD(P)H-binding protein [Jeotgalibacillus sp. R-1-5s-1]|uniref:NAD(P)H-binding protein n=1 Tax=Jeotgalibacillus sp. R-1-5s-1 TaxID=2555897 RepID=UPI00106BA245|nr:NAD(P)H-binding protein [Jeotgalibacillus sp. R-1-5s-1]TFD99665.1 NAD-dependent epimerase/dehydratase family protein [Jeotgalibacillus sp. R-1-5s-1]
MDKRRPVVALTGATGYIGGNLLNQIQEKADVIALSRSADDKENTEHVTWRSCDFFSLKDAEKALEGADFAIYLIHSMKPSAKLTQASFEDMDVILADNFARAAKKQGIKQIIYLSGIIPEGEKKLSRHLKSRLEVEKVLKAYGTPVTTIRAGLIVGPSGSSFPILAKLAKRLPFMLLPKWTRTKTHPIALKDVLHSLRKTVGNKEVEHQSIDVGGPEVMSYKEMMIKTAEVMGRSPKVVDVPLMTVQLSRLWVMLVTGAPKEMVYPLVESLEHPMVAKNKVEGISDGKIPFKEAAKTALEEQENDSNMPAYLKPNPTGKDVRSVQRVMLPKGKNALWAGEEYLKWLATLAKPLLWTDIDNQKRGRIHLISKNNPLLELTFSPDESDEFRSLYRITGGAFASIKENSRGRIEFRQIPDTQECIIAIHEYEPALPWFIYRYTQANVHLLVMYLFKKYLEHLMKNDQHEEQAGDRKEIAEA